MKATITRNDRPQNISRNRFLRMVSIFALSTVELKAQPKGKKVIVIGAGIAGIAAARSLKSSGYDVVILEGRDRIGGRIWTDRSLGVPVDLGASWIHKSSANHPIEKLAREFRIPIVESDYDSSYKYDMDGKLIADDVAAELIEKSDSIIKRSLRIADEEERNPAQTIQLIAKGENLSAVERRFLDWRIYDREAEEGEDFGKFSLEDGEADSFGEDEWLFPNGYDAIPQRLADGLDIRRSTIVNRINTIGSKVKVETTQGNFEGDFALVSVPVGVLAKGSIEFNPGLSAEKKSAIAQLGMGVLNKTVLQFTKSFWPTDREFLAYVGEKKGYYPAFLNMMTLNKTPALLSFTAGTFARSLETQSDNEVKSQIMSVLRKIFGNGIPDPVAFQRTRWNTDLFSFGSYSYLKPGGDPSARAVLSRRAGNILFAGEATSSDYPSTVHGAYLSGLRAATEIASA